MGDIQEKNSFKQARNILETTSNNTGRLFALSYLQDILPWLYEMLGRRIWSGLAELSRDMLKSGIVQYANYIEGQHLLGLREEKDGYERFREDVLKVLATPEWPLANIMQMCTWVDLLLLKEREGLYKTMDEDLFRSFGRKGQQQFLKIMFYRAFDIAVPDEEFYVQIPVMTKETDDMTAAIELWEDTEDSVVQVDVWCVGGNSSTYDKAFEQAFNNAQGLQVGQRTKYMTWNEKK